MTEIYRGIKLKKRVYDKLLVFRKNFKDELEKMAIVEKYKIPIKITLSDLVEHLLDKDVRSQK